MFPSPSGVFCFLWVIQTLSAESYRSFRPPRGSFVFYIVSEQPQLAREFEFPSPSGVFCFLLKLLKIMLSKCKFPSPSGVFCFLFNILIHCLFDFLGFRPPRGSFVFYPVPYFYVFSMAPPAPCVGNFKISPCLGKRQAEQRISVEISTTA